jgi:hypothetical protein
MHASSHALAPVHPSAHVSKTATFLVLFFFVFTFFILLFYFPTALMSTFYTLRKLLDLTLLNSLLTGTKWSTTTRSAGQEMSLRGSGTILPQRARLRVTTDVDAPGSRT